MHHSSKAVTNQSPCCSREEVLISHPKALGSSGIILGPQPRTKNDVQEGGLSLPYSSTVRELQQLFCISYLVFLLDAV